MKRTLEYRMSGQRMEERWLSSNQLLETAKRYGLLPYASWLSISWRLPTRPMSEKPFAATLRSKAKSTIRVPKITLIGHAKLNTWKDS